jgi:hypothetical protein
VEIECADCGCLVERGVIVTACVGYPSCCCGSLRQASADRRD